MPDLKVIGGSGSQKTGEPSRKRTRGKDADIKPDIALLDAELMPKFALDEDLQTIRAIVKFIVSSPPSDWKVQLLRFVPNLDAYLSVSVSLHHFSTLEISSSGSPTRTFASFLLVDVKPKLPGQLPTEWVDSHWFSLVLRTPTSRRN